MPTDQPANRGPELLITNIVFVVLAGIIVLLRCYTRAVLVRAFGLDDWIMVLATILFITYCVSSNCGVRHGTGQHRANLDHDSISSAMKYWWFCYFFYAFTMVCCKISFAWFLLRVTARRLHKWIIYGASLLTVVAGLTFFFVTLFQCSPVSFFWNKDQSGRCVDMNIIIGLAYLYSVVSMTTDFTFAILPAFVIWNLQLQMRAKIAVLVLMTMGCIASAAVVVRFAYLPNLKDPDFLWATIDVAIWSTVEMGLAVAAASLATLRPLFKIVRLATQGTKLTNPPTLTLSLPTGEPGDTNNASEDRIYITSDIVLGDSFPARRSELQFGVQSKAYAEPRGKT